MKLNRRIFLISILSSLLLFGNSSGPAHPRLMRSITVGTTPIRIVDTVDALSTGYMSIYSCPRFVENLTLKSASTNSASAIIMVGTDSATLSSTEGGIELVTGQSYMFPPSKTLTYIGDLYVVSSQASQKLIITLKEK